MAKRNISDFGCTHSLYIGYVIFVNKIIMNLCACLHSDPSPTQQRLNKNVNNDVSLRLHNLTVLTRHIRMYYQETLQQLIVMPLPNILCIAKDPLSGTKSMEDLKRLLLLILGCAVQCERKEEMIEKIKLLDIETQGAIVSHIQEVTHNQLNVLDLSWLEEGSELPHEELEHLSRNMAVSLQQLIEQRDKDSEVIVDLTQERDYLCSQQIQEGCRNLGMSSLECAQVSGEEKQHLSVELADTKVKLRRYRQELEEKTEQLMDSKHEVERLDQELQILKQENQSLSCEARSVRVYRDEVDSLRERAARVDRLETELNRCREKLNDVQFYKTRIEELREDNMTLMETKVLLEEQLSASRGRCDKMHTLEKDNLLLRAKIHDLEMERDNERRRLEELVEENMLLEIGQKQSMNESAHLGWELEQLTKNHDNTNTETRKSLVLELNECVSSRVLKLEKENRELQASIERLKEDNHLLQEQQLNTQVLDRENQCLSKKLECLQGLLDQERLTNQDMESLGEEILKEKQSLERETHTLRTEKDRQILELESEKQHLSDVVVSLQDRAQSNNVRRVREVEAENRLLHRNITDTSSRLANLETQLKLANVEAERLRETAGRVEEVERDAARLERSRDALRREVASLRACSERSEALEKQMSSLEQEMHRLKWEAGEAQREKHLEKESLRIRTLLEGKESELEDIARQLITVEKERSALSKEVDRLKEVAVKAKELERENKELQKQATIDKRTLATLREELVSEKLSVQQQSVELERVNEELEKIGLSREKLLQQEYTLEDRYNLLKEQLKQLENQNTSLNNQMVAQQRHITTLQEQNSALHTQTAKLQVENSMLSSQGASLMAQNTVLQGQVTALEAEMETWQRQREEAWRGRESILNDHERLLSVHERQAHEYEQLISLHTTLKGKQRALESEHRALQSKEKWEEQEVHGQKEKEELNQQINKLTENQSQQSEQSEGLKQRMNELKKSLSSTQLEVSRWMARYDALMEQHQGLDLTMTKLDNHCELLSRLKGNLEEENHHLLSQINLLSQQNHTLLERSMESKEMYHQEQKLYIDKLNALRRQKEKLEEKIMDQYKFYDPTPKKKSQWSGAKAFAKLIKPRKESSKERGGERDKEGGKDRERAKSAPDIPLPAPPTLFHPETPPPLPERMASDSQDNDHTHGTHNSYTSSLSLGPQSPPLTPIGQESAGDHHLTV
uniref:Coiled-coil domain containing 88C n=1 Tax=Sparus aurata TaxID=8175 RepID=A0A671XHG0_SPAAU